uniref:Uncharacterized protein n=1 Tax=Oryza glumipatula TaxID=40148 RepID=A0A0D9Y853_9ORYZ
MGDKQETQTMKTHFVVPTKKPTADATPQQEEHESDLPEEFRVTSPPPLSPPPYPLSPSMEDDGMIYAEDLGYMSTPCPSPPSDVDDLNPLEDPNNKIILHPAFIDDDGDLDIIQDDIYNFRYDQTPPRDAQSPATRFKRHKRD